MIWRNFFRDLRHTASRLVSVSIITLISVMVYIALSGLGVALVGGLARFAFSQMFRMVSAGWGAMDPFGSGGWELVLPDGTVTSGGMSGISSMGQVFLTFATVILAVGLVITLAGAVLAVVLYRKGRKNR